MNNNSLIDALAEYMFVPNRPLVADATIVLGMTLWQRPLARALELFNEGKTGIMIFSGGYNAKLNASEAGQMESAWTKLGTSYTDILIDDQSSNTRENMLNSKKLLTNIGSLSDDMTINIVAISYHMRRCVETFRDVFGNKISLGISNYPSKYCDPELWHLNQQGRRLIIGEAIKILHYLPNAQAPSVLKESLELLTSAMQSD